MKRVWLLLGALIGIAISVILYASLHARKITPSQAPQVNLSAFHSETYPINFQYPSSMQPTIISKEDKAAHIIFRGIQRSQNINPFQLTLRYEKEIDKAAALSHQDPLDMLISNTKKAYPLRFPQYKEIKWQEFNRGGNKAAELLFTYKNNDQIIKQRFYMIINSSTAYYFSGQAKTKDFDFINENVFNLIYSSIKF